MQITFIMTIINLIILIAFISAVVYLFMLIVRALKKYINSQDVRKEKSETRKSLGEVLKKYRTDNKMTQEFWESADRPSPNGNREPPSRRLQT